MSLAVITDPDWGWLSIRLRWKRHLPAYVNDLTWFDLEHFGGWEKRVPYVRRFKWLRSALEGRRAARRAYARGHRTMLVATLQYAPLFPLMKDVRYFIYGDATPRQYDNLYCEEYDDRLRKRSMRARYRRLAQAGHHMLCMSPWYRDGLIEHYGVRKEQTTILRPPIDVEAWQPSPRKDQAKLNLLFIGGDFHRKSGDMLLELSNDPRFAACRWHFVTGHQGRNNERCTFYNRLQADTPELRKVVESCDLFVMPTKADCSPLAAIEAGAAGLPAIITDVGGISDIVETGVNGVLIPRPHRCEVEEALLEYLTDPQKLEREGVNARKRVEERNSIPVHMAILKELLS